jgi:hypothetical protein
MFDPWQAGSEIFRVWVPFLSGVAVVWRVYKTGKSTIDAWADKLLDNHLHHIQLSLDKQTELLEKIANK